MTVPDYQTMMRPILLICKEEAKNTNSVVEEFVNIFQLTEEDLKIMQPNGTDLLVRNRIQWAFKYLLEAGLLDRTQRGYYITTEIGQNVVEKYRDRVDNSVLQVFESFNKWRDKSRSKKSNGDNNTDQLDSRTPDEKIRDVHQDIMNSLKAELLQKILRSPPDFFEKMVLDLLIAMKYGGSYEEASQHVGRSNDEGIDGIINEDRLGLDKIYIQAKRWKEKNISNQHLRDFVGSLSQKGANKGLFITTSEFTSEAIKVAKEVPQKYCFNRQR